MNAIIIRNLALALLTIGTIGAQAQTDYRKLPLWDSMLSCGNHDTVLTHRLITKLKAINPDTLLNRHIYYKDLGMCYYDLYFNNSSNTANLVEAVKYLEQSAAADSMYDQAQWNLAISYFLLGDCKNSVAHLNKYLATTPRKKRDKGNIASIRKRCK